MIFISVTRQNALARRRISFLVFPHLLTNLGFQTLGRTADKSCENNVGKRTPLLQKVTRSATIGRA
jgi:hypothetical protein